MSKLENYQTPATPAISLIYSLETQLARIEEEGIEARWQRHADMQQKTLEWVSEMQTAGVGIEVFATEGHRSPTVTCLATPEGVASSAVVAKVAAEGWVIGGGYGKLSESTIRIGHMGDHTVDELEGLLDVLGDAL